MHYTARNVNIILNICVLGYSYAQLYVCIYIYKYPFCRLWFTIIVDGNECEHSLVLMKPWRYEHANIVTFEVCVMPERHYCLYLFLCVNVFLHIWSFINPFHVLPLLYCRVNIPPILTKSIYSWSVYVSVISMTFQRTFILCVWEHLYCVYENIYICVYENIYISVVVLRHV